MNPFAPLFAAGDDAIVKIIIAIIVFILAGASQLIAKYRQIPPRGQRPLAPRPEKPDTVADEIEEFMRRAAERRASRGTRRAGEQAETVAKTASPAQPVQAQVVAEKPVGGQVADHVKKYLDEDAFARREDSLGKEIAQADSEIDQHLRQTFDHRVGQLAAVPGEAAAPTAAAEPPELAGLTADSASPFTTGLLDLMSDPDSLRQAIVLNEVLRRPEERWA